ncbi:MAG TPA: FeoA family protein [Phycisphaerae bacterium]|nr:FeoA family protein [Phycisphaerae bacterium]
MTMIAENIARTVHLPTEIPAPTPPLAPAGKPARRKGLRLTDLRAGETVRILRVAIEESGCRKRFAELGLAEGMKVTIASTGDTLMLIIGGSRMGIASRCAEAILVSRISA